MKKPDITIAAHFHPAIDRWTGFAVDMNNGGTHESYNVIYNGVCELNKWLHECSNEHEAKMMASAVAVSYLSELPKRFPEFKPSPTITHIK